LCWPLSFYQSLNFFNNRAGLLFFHQAFHYSFAIVQ
jgi:hypothetical protein